MIARIAPFCLWLVGCLGSAFGGEWHVNAETGKDDQLGTMAAPFATIQRAVDLSAEGDTIFLHPEGALYRQSATISGKSGLMIEGNGVTLDGADPLPAEDWEKLEADLYRKKMPRTQWDRHLLIFNGRMERMGRTQSSNSPEFPPVGELKSGEFRFENIDDAEGWLYVRGTVNGLEWATRVNGIGTGGTLTGLRVKNLKARHFLNDGFNIHGKARGLLFENVEGYDCFDEGFSAHDTCEAEIVNGRFWGNENGIADVNAAETTYRQCEFRDNVNTDVLLIGLQHQLIDCRIVNTTTAAALVGGPRGEDQGFRLELSKVEIIAEGKTGNARVRVNGGRLKISDSTFTQVDFNVIGAEMEAVALTVNGAAYQP